MLNNQDLYGHFVETPYVRPMGEGRLMTSLFLDLTGQQARYVSLVSSSASVIEKSGRLGRNQPVLLRGRFIANPTMEGTERPTFSATSAITETGDLAAFRRRAEALVSVLPEDHQAASQARPIADW